jgi:chromosomal replication initiator protein
MSADLWQRGCERLAAELPEIQFNTWIRPLAPAEITETTGSDPDSTSSAVATLRVPNRFKLDWIRSQYAPRIESVLSELAGMPVRLDITLGQADAPDSQRQARAGTAPQRGNGQQPGLDHAGKPEGPQPVSAALHGGPAGAQASSRVTGGDQPQNRHRLNTR